MLLALYVLLECLIVMFSTYETKRVSRDCNRYLALSIVSSFCFVNYFRILVLDLATSHSFLTLRMAQSLIERASVDFVALNSC